MIDVRPTDKLCFDLSMLQIDYNEAKKAELREKIASKYNVPLRNVIVNFVPLTQFKDGKKLSLTSDVINNIQDEKFQQKLFHDYMEAKGIENVNFDDIIAIDNSINVNVDFDSYRRYKTYKFKYVKWKNFLSYGEDNYLDFTKLNGLVLLNSKPANQGGKSTLSIDLLRFALFGKSQKAPTLDSVFNTYTPEATEVMVEAGIEIDDCDYVIRRTITRPPLRKRTAKSKPKQKVEYYKLLNEQYELIENFEGESTTQTNNIIRESVGSVDDYNLVISATSYSLGDLLRMGQTEKSKLFSRWLGLLTLEQKETIAKKYYKESVVPNLYSKQYNAEVIKTEITDFTNCINNNNEQVIQLQQSYQECDKRIHKIEEERLETMSKRREVNTAYANLSIETINAQIQTCTNEITRKKLEQANIKSQIADYGTPVFNPDEYNALVQTINNKNIQVATLRHEYSTLCNENNRLIQLIQAQICPNCGQHIDVQTKNEEIAANNIKGLDITQQGKNINQELVQLNQQKLIMEQNRDAVNQVRLLSVQLVAVENNIETLSLQSKELHRQVSEIEKMSENIKFNAELDILLNSINARITTERQNQERLIREAETIKNTNTRYLEEVNKRKVLLEQLEKEEVLMRTWALYLEMVGKNGIVKIVLNQALPIINNELKRILADLCDFDVELSIIDNKICIQMVRDGVYMDLSTCASGFESTISALALRSALASVSNVSHSNMLVLDEILDGVAVDNYANIRELYNRIVQNYQFILHITHNELISDWHNQIITVKKNDHISSVEMITKN